MEINHLPVDVLQEAPNNSRTHDPEQVQQIASSITEFGFTNPILVDELFEIIAGHGRLMAAQSIGMTTVPCVVLQGLTEAQKRAYVIADNQLPLNAGWDLDVLKSEIENLQDLDFDIGLLGFDDDFLGDLLADALPPEPVPELSEHETHGESVARTGDVWILGENRVMCGDSLNVSDVEKLVGGKLATVLHADPPYGMNKGTVENDDLHGDDLDRFQLDWWSVWRSFTSEKGSAYIWGNAYELWRLWFTHLEKTETMELRNEIVWDKQSAQGMSLEAVTMYPTGSERCLFIQMGNQLLDNVNSEDYWEGWDVCREYLVEQADAVDLNPSRCREITGTQSYPRWFSTSQWSLIPEKHYHALAAEYPGYFAKPYEELKSAQSRARQNYGDHVGSYRAHFDNTHDNMRDVWEYPIVQGDDRHGHDTPKPVDMMERICKTSAPEGGLILEPFGGTGSTLLAAQRTGRVCYTMEITPAHVDVIVRRWQSYTNQSAFLQETGEPFGE